MKKTRQLFLFIIFLAYTTFINAQSAITLDASQLYASFKFNDTDGNKLNSEYQGIFTGAYGIGYNYVANFGLVINPRIGMRNAGASMVYDDISYSWRLQYAEFKLGLGYVYEMKRIKPYFIASAYYGYLLRGTQVLNNENFNITKSGLLNEMDYGVVLNPGIKIDLSEYVSFYTEFLYLMGLNNIEMDEGQKTGNLAYGLTIGLSFSITKN